VADDVRYVTDLAAGRLVIMRACYDSLNGCDEKAHPEAYERHYAFTAQFVHDYWGDFADRSLIFLDFCSSNSTISTSLTTELLAKHAGLVLGWDDVTNDADAGATALFIFDRLVGANDFRTEMGFKQRAFDWISALSDCSNHSVCTSNSAHLVATEPAPGCRNNPGACDDAFGLLAPSIRQMYVFESYAREIAPDLLFIVGLFGRDQGSGRFDPLRGVSIGGNDVPIFDWGPNLIAVELPHTGAGSSGEVVVRVRNHTSNVAQLTEWEVPFTLVLDDFQSLRQTVTVKARFRVDIRKSVRTIHQAPDDPQPSGLEFQALRYDSTSTYVCAGTASIVTNEGTETETWSGSGAIADFKNLTKFSPVAVVTSTLIGLNLSGWNQDCDSVLMVSGYPPAPGNPVVIDPQEISPAPDGSTAGSVDLQLDTVGNVFGDAKTKTVQSHSALNADGNAAAVWRWPMTSPVPGTAPDPNSAR